MRDHMACGITNGWRMAAASTAPRADSSSASSNRPWCMRSEPSHTSPVPRTPATVSARPPRRSRSAPARSPREWRARPESVSALVRRSSSLAVRAASSAKRSALGKSRLVVVGDPPGDLQRAGAGAPAHGSPRRRAGRHRSRWRPARLGPAARAGPSAPGAAGARRRGASVRARPRGSPRGAPRSPPRVTPRGPPPGAPAPGRRRRAPTPVGRARHARASATRRAASS